MAHSRIEGPVYIGENTTILGGNIKSSSIGKNCKIYGEVSDSIFQGYSNKAHHGFIGHSYIGEWVNLGAGTTTSNLKINYDNVKLKKGNQLIQTQSMFLGSIIGDYAKTAIGVQLNTGTIIHTGSVLLESYQNIKEIPSFSWGNPKNNKTVDIEKFIRTTQNMYHRRNKKLDDRQIELLNFLYESHKIKYESFHI